MAEVGDSALRWAARLNTFQQQMMACKLCIRQGLELPVRVAERCCPWETLIRSRSPAYGGRRIGHFGRPTLLPGHNKQPGPGRRASKQKNTMEMALLGPTRRVLCSESVCARLVYSPPRPAVASKPERRLQASLRNATACQTPTGTRCLCPVEKTTFGEDWVLDGSNDARLDRGLWRLRCDS